MFRLIVHPFNAMAMAQRQVDQRRVERKVMVQN